MPRTHPSARSAIILLLFLFAAVCAGCRVDTTGLSTLTVEELAKLRDSGADLVLCDANSDKTRGEEGVIPGAVLLDLKTDFTGAKMAAVAAKDQNVVIYCMGPKCLRSSNACAKAVSWGFRGVHYFREGFPSWKAAGYPVAVP